MKRLSKKFIFTMLTGAFALALAFAGSAAVGAYDAYFKITVDQYQCGTFTRPDTGESVFAIYGTGGATWSYPDDTTITTRLELLSPFPLVYFDDMWDGWFGGGADSGSASGVDAAFPVDPEGYPVTLKFTSTTSVGGVPTYEQTLTLTCDAEGAAVPSEAERSLVTPAITIDATGGSSVTVNGTNFPANQDVTIGIESVRTTLGTVTTSSAGTFSVTYTVPCTVGNGSHTIFATIVSTSAEVSAPVVVSGCSSGVEVAGASVTAVAAAPAPAVAAAPAPAVAAAPRTTG